MAIYKGTEIKFAINLQAEGFSMDEDDFEVAVASPQDRIVGQKNAGVDDPKDVVIFSETVTPEEGEPTTQWFVIADTSKLHTGDLRVIATARIIDQNANDGVRNEIAVQSLGKLINP